MKALLNSNILIAITRILLIGTQRNNAFTEDKENENRQVNLLSYGNIFCLQFPAMSQRYFIFIVLRMK